MRRTSRILFCISCLPLITHTSTENHSEVKRLYCDPVITANTSECSCYYEGEKTEGRSNQNMLFLDDSSFEMKCAYRKPPAYSTLQRMLTECAFQPHRPRRVYLCRLEYCVFSDTSFVEILRTLDIEPASVSQLFVRYWPNIGDVDTALHFENFTSLTTFDFSNNYITHLPETIFDHMTNLAYLVLQNNSINTLRRSFHTDDGTIFANLRQLQNLSLNENDLIDMPRNLFVNNLRLQKIELTKCCNRALTTLPDVLFANLPSLSVLLINDNGFVHLPDNLLRNSSALTRLHLGGNSLRTLPASIFADTCNLRHLNVDNNRFEFLDDQTFRPLKNLISVAMNNASSPLMTTLPPALFANITSLINVTLNENHFDRLPDDLFRNCRELRFISMARNCLKNLPPSLFDSTKNLKVLDLDDNQLEFLAPPLFHSLRDLQELKLARNRIHSLHDDVFKKQMSLQKLDLSSNHLTNSFVDNLFARTTSLTLIDLSNNKLTFTPRGIASERSDPIESPFSKCEKLETLNLRNNSIDMLFFDWKHSRSLKTLDLSNNRFQRLTSKDFIFSQHCDDFFRIDLSDNQIEGVFLDNLENATERNYRALDRTPYSRCEIFINLRNNPITCNCSMYDTAHHLHEKTLQSAHIKLEHFHCHEPQSLRNISLSKVNRYELKCPLNAIHPEEAEICPKNCTCEYRPVDQTIIVDCTDTGMWEFPSQLPNVGNFSIELLLANNYLMSLDGLKQLVRAARLSKLSLSFNKLTNIDDLVIPSGLKSLMLDNNEISSLSQKTIELLNASETLTDLTLHKNPWRCDCESQPFVEYLQYQNQNKKQRIENYENITCHRDDRLIIHIQTEYLCDGLFIKTILLVALFTTALLIIAALVLYHIYEHEIKVWMFAHKICLWLVTEKELDKNKKYDAFVSFSTKDELFVVNNLMPVLERNTEHPLKLCIHHRDFVPGEYIPDQIANAVENSRRTIIVLSPNFLESVWTRMEFKLAHLKAMEERRARVVIILLSEVDTENLDPRLKAYITMNTYVKWGDPWFWQKLRYALPHPDTSSKRR